MYSSSLSGTARALLGVRWKGIQPTVAAASTPGTSCAGTTPHSTVPASSRQRAGARGTVGSTPAQSIRPTTRTSASGTSARRRRPACQMISSPRSRVSRPVYTATGREGAPRGTFRNRSRGG